MRVLIDSLEGGARNARGTVVVLDVFRAFTTAAVAFSRGVREILLVAGVDEALELRDRGLADIAVGEVGGVMPDGFDFGNSPFELSQADVDGKTLVQRTSAGTLGVTAATNADRTYVSSLVVARATAMALRREAPDLVTIVAMGGDALVRTDEDEQCAMYIRNLVEGRRPDPEAVRSLVLAGDQAAKYGDPALNLTSIRRTWTGPCASTHSTSPWQWSGGDDLLVARSSRPSDPHGPAAIWTRRFAKPREGILRGGTS